MEISPATLGPLFQTFDMRFQQGFTMPETYWEDICMLAPSGTSQNTYPWLGRTTKFREWLGPRVLEMLEAHAYAIVNKDFEDTVGVKRNSIEDDQYGVYGPMFEQLGWDSKSHPDTLVFSLIIKALNNVDAGSPTSDILGYDGKTFFSTVHPVGLAGATSAVSNCDLSHGGGNLVTNQPWLLVDAGRPVRPFIFQKRKEYTMTRMNALTDEAVFMEKVFRFGVDCRVNAGWGLWQLCYASNADLSDPSAFAEAIAAMRKFKTDAGLPFGSWSSKKKYLVVGPDNEGKARQILNATFAVGLGASNAVATTNIWNGAAELVVTPYLQF